MESNKLKIKIGEHEFEAEGPAEIVQAQFAAFKDMVLSAGAETRHKPAEKVAEPEYNQDQVRNAPTGALALDKIMNIEGRLVSLTVRAASLQDAILLVALGQKQFRSNDAITGGEIIDGLKQSGQVVSRIDRTLTRLAEEGHIIKLGAGRGSRYRMTNQGVAKAQEIAKSVISLVA